jgi:hypothetical protein
MLNHDHTQADSAAMTHSLRIQGTSRVAPLALALAQRSLANHNYFDSPLPQASARVWARVCARCRSVSSWRRFSARCCRSAVCSTRTGPSIANAIRLNGRFKTGRSHRQGRTSRRLPAAPTAKIGRRECLANANVPSSAERGVVERSAGSPPSLLIREAAAICARLQCGRHSCRTKDLPHE